MGKNSLTRGAVTSHASGIGPATRARTHARARELAVIAGHAPHQVTPSDYAQARRELAGESEVDPQEAALDALPESKRWDPVPGSEGRQTPEFPGEDDDDEGRNESAQLVAVGVNAAAHDQMLQAARAAVAEESAPSQP
jgi:hypothetical protein